VRERFVHTPDVQSLDVALKTVADSGVPLRWIPPGLSIGMADHGSAALLLIAFRTPKVSADFGYIVSRI
jgi:hypothetical protein